MSNGYISSPQSAMAHLPGVVGDGRPFNGFSLPQVFSHTSALSPAEFLIHLKCWSNTLSFWSVFICPFIHSICYYLLACSPTFVTLGVIKFLGRPQPANRKTSYRCSPCWGITTTCTVLTIPPGHWWQTRMREEPGRTPWGVQAARESSPAYWSHSYLWFPCFLHWCV